MRREVIAHPELVSVIVSNFPAILKEFRRKHFQILWRGDGDGFRAS
jgi:hypothetical protein